MSLSKSKECMTVATKKRKLLHMSKQGRTETTGVKKQQPKLLYTNICIQDLNFFLL